MSARFVLFVLLSVCFGLRAARADNWPQWRGARHDGICRETNVPVKFSKTEGLAWAAPSAEPCGFDARRVGGPDLPLVARPG